VQAKVAKGRLGDGGDWLASLSATARMAPECSTRKVVVVVEGSNVQVRSTSCRNEGSNSTMNVVRLSEADGRALRGRTTGRAGQGRFLP
jgi:hypothetical protein